MRRAALGSKQRGVILLGAVLVILIGLGLYALSRMNSGGVRATAQSNETRDQLTKVRDALVNFVAANGYLPCPAVGTLATGLANPTTANATCNTPAGVVPWGTIGLSSAETLDPYQQKISYRVFSGATGFTRSGGANMSSCDSVRGPLPIPQTVGVDGSGFCRFDHDTSPAQFLAGKGLSLTDAGTAVTGAAFILIAHGQNGAGAFRADGVQNALPNAASAEYGNTQANGPFVAKAANTANLAATDVNYFDDSLMYLTMSDLAGRTKVATARDWPDPTALLSFNTATIAAAAAAAGVTPTGTSTNATTLAVNGLTVTASGAAGVEISTRVGTSGEGIGVLSGTATTGGSISGTDVLTLSFGSTGQKLGIMLVDFGSSFGQAERAQLVFKNGATTVLTTTLLACGSGAVLASYSVDVGASFDRVELSALTRVGSGSSSTFLLGELALCSSSATTCTTASANVSTACAYP